ncbi:MAG: tetratricopeptide repeat protein [Armatimonadota bacterium]
MSINRTLPLLTVSVVVLTLVVGCGPRKSPREIETGSKAGDTPSPAASQAVGAGDVSKAFPSIALDYPPLGEVPGIDAAETEVAKDGNSAAALRNLGYAYYKAAAYPQAAEYFEKSAKVAPDQPETLLFAGQSYMGMGDLDKALASLTKASALKGGKAEVKSLAFLQMGNCLFQQQKDPAAKAAFTKSLALNPKQGAAKIALGTYAAMDKQTAKAKTLFTEATRDLASSRVRGKAYASLGLIAEQAGDKAGALANYKKALSDDPNSAAAKAGIKRVGG